MSERLFKLIIAVRKKCFQTEEKVRSELRLTPAEFNGLLSLEPGEKANGVAFAQRMALSPSRASRVVSRLTGRGFFFMEAVPGDRRSVNVSLTPKGGRMRANIESRMMDCEKRIASQLSPAEEKKVRSAMELLIRIM